jgi:hypothetical protein
LQEQPTRVVRTDVQLTTPHKNQAKLTGKTERQAVIDFDQIADTAERLE